MDIISGVRRLVLPDETSIVGYRIGATNGRSYVVRRDLDGSGQNGKSNLPIDCALCEVGASGIPTVKKFFIHDLPDGWIAGTQIVPGNLRQLRDLVRLYTQRGFQVRFQRQNAITAAVLSIDAAGTLVLLAPMVLAVNNLVQFLSCRDINDRAIRGTFAIASRVDDTHYTLAQWTGQTVSRRGRCRLVSFDYAAALYLGDDRAVVGAASRKAGRPFFQQRGRVPVRR